MSYYGVKGSVEMQIEAPAKTKGHFHCKKAWFSNKAPRFKKTKLQTKSIHKSIESISN